MYDLITLDLYICLVRPPPQAYQLKPFSPSNFPYSFILINSLVWKVHIVWNFNFLSEGKCDYYFVYFLAKVKVNGVNVESISES